MKRGIILFLFVGMIAFIHAQVIESYECFSVNENGHILILKDCNSQEVADYLNTSPQIASRIIETVNRNTNESLFLHKGDIISLDNSLNLDTGDMPCTGKMIRYLLNTPLDQYLFSNYWLGYGDVELSAVQFARILLCIKQNQLITNNCTQNKTNSRIVSFYDTPYEQAFGFAQIIQDTNNRIIGFYDSYDFDPKEWGIRPFKYELYVRIIALLSPSTSSAFNIYFDEKMLLNNNCFMGY